MTKMNISIEQEVSTPWGIMQETVEQVHKVNLPVTITTAAQFRDTDELDKIYAAKYKAINSPFGLVLAKIAAAVRSLPATHAVAVRCNVHRPTYHSPGYIRKFDGKWIPAHASIENPTASVQLTIDGEAVTIGFESERTQISPWRSRENGKMRVWVYHTVLKYNRHAGRNVNDTQRKSFPQRKAGGFNYEEIARTLITEVERTQVVRRQEQVRVSNRSAVTELKTELGLRDYSSLMTVSSDPDKPIMVNLSGSFNGTPAQAKALVTAIRTVIPNYGK